MTRKDCHVSRQMLPNSSQMCVRSNFAILQDPHKCVQSQDCITQLQSKANSSTSQYLHVTVIDINLENKRVDAQVLTCTPQAELLLKQGSNLTCYV
jgi:hypothetical protein